MNTSPQQAAVTAAPDNIITTSKKPSIIALIIANELIKAAVSDTPLTVTVTPPPQTSLCIRSSSPYRLHKAAQNRFIK